MFACVHVAGAEIAGQRAESLHWMVFEQHSLEPNIGRGLFLCCRWSMAAGDLQTHSLED